MARYTGPKHRLARREGVNILEKQSASLERRLTALPGVHGRKGRRKTSEYGMQLREKQKLKRIYGLMEKQFSKNVAVAQKKKENTTDALVELLESRLDNVVYRLGFAKTRTQARQFVSHNHVTVNGNRVNIPSYLVKPGEVIALEPKFAAVEVIKQMIEEKTEFPEFLKRENGQGKLLRAPKSDEISNPVDYQLVIEFYSR